MTTYIRYAVTVIVAAATAAALAAALFFGLTARPPVHDCDLTQPVYAGTAMVGSWHATLRYGQSVLLPDGDTATCTPGELVIS